MSEDSVFLTIIGAGVVGCAIARELSGVLSEDILVVEKNRQINGENQSSRNSGVIHSGIYYPKDSGPLKSRLCVEGNILMYDFCSGHSVPFEKTGKIVVATNEIEIEYLQDVLRISKENNVPGIRMITTDEIKDLEPNVEGIKALFVPTAGIVEPTILVERLHELAEKNGVIFLTGNEVREIEPSSTNGGFKVKLISGNSSESFNTKILINSAGLYSDEVAKMINPDFPHQMDPVKGDSAKFYSSRRPEINLNGTNVYPVPFGYYPDGERANVSFNEFFKLFKENKVYKSAGVHLTPTFDFVSGKYEIGNTVTIGPAYSRPHSREDYKNNRDILYFHDMVNPFFPDLEVADISLHQTGIRAKLKNHYDFVIEKDKKFPCCIHLTGIDSPGLTSCLSIAGYVSNILKSMI